MVIEVVVAAIASLGVGTLLGRWITWRSIESAKRLPPPVRMKDKEYDVRRKFVIKEYEHGQDQYDRLIPWGAGGALFLSIGAIEKVFPHPLPSTMWVLAVGWGCLFLALACSIAGHYTSARAYLADQQALDLAQQETLSAEERASYQRLMQNLGILDSWTTITNGVALFGLLGGVLLLILFAFANVG